LQKSLDLPTEVGANGYCQFTVISVLVLIGDSNTER